MAEGVETALEWDLVVASDCDLAQGYLIGPPSPPRSSALVQAEPGVTPAAA